MDKKTGPASIISEVFSGVSCPDLRVLTLDNIETRRKHCAEEQDNDETVSSVSCHSACSRLQLHVMNLEQCCVAMDTVRNGLQCCASSKRVGTLSPVNHKGLYQR